MEEGSIWKSQTHLYSKSGGMKYQIILKKGIWRNGFATRSVISREEKESAKKPISYGEKSSISKGRWRKEKTTKWTGINTWGFSMQISRLVGWTKASVGTKSSTIIHQSLIEKNIMKKEHQ